jgi:hypothetical protein
MAIGVIIAMSDARVRKPMRRALRGSNLDENSAEFLLELGSSMLVARNCYEIGKWTIEINK